jgi:hypothetical protein
VKPPPAAPVVEVAHLAQVLVLAVVSLLWLDRHLGFGLRGWGPLAGLLVAAGAGWKLVRTLADGAAAQATTRAARWGRAVFSRGVRVSWALALLFAITFFSSVTLVSSAAVAPRADLQPVAERSAAVWGPYEEKETTRWVVRTSPFGTLFRLAVRGHLRETIDVFPVLGARVRQRDLRPTVAVLLRPGVFGRQALVEGRLRVWAEKPGGPLIAEVEKPGRAVLLGGRAAIPAAWIEEWALELKSMGAEAAAFDTMMLAWRRPLVVPPGLDLEPGMVLVARIENRKGHVIAEEAFTLGAESPADLPLTDDVQE